MIVNIYDERFIKNSPSSTGYKKAVNINYVQNKKTWDGLTIFTDNCLGSIPYVDSKYKVFWQLETPALSNKFFYKMLKRPANILDMVITYDESLIKSDPNKFKRGSFGGYTANSPMMYKKSKLACIVDSGKRRLRGHKLRGEAAKDSRLNVYGRSTGKPFENITSVYSDYRYAVVIENNKHENYFTEKLTDAIACGCVPIYWGCPNIDLHFDMEGIIVIDDIESLQQVLSDIQNDKSHQMYSIRMNSLIHNLNVVKNNFYTNEDWLYNNYLHIFDSLTTQNY